MAFSVPKVLLNPSQPTSLRFNCSSSQYSQYLGVLWLGWFFQHPVFHRLMGSKQVIILVMNKQRACCRILSLVAQIKPTLMKNCVMCSLLLKWRHSTWLGMLNLHSNIVLEICCKLTCVQCFDTVG